jgi:hypothetical protein
MSSRFSIPSRGSGALHFNDACIRIPFLFAACRRATKSTALARCVRSGRDNKSRCSGSATSRNSPRALFLSSLSLSLSLSVEENDVGDAVHFADLPAPPAEFDVRDNIEAEGDLPSLSRMDLAPGSVPRDRRRSISRAREVESTVIYLTAMLSTYTEPTIYDVVVSRIPE